MRVGFFSRPKSNGLISPPPTPLPPSALAPPFPMTLPPSPSSRGHGPSHDLPRTRAPWPHTAFLSGMLSSSNRGRPPFLRGEQNIKVSNLVGLDLPKEAGLDVLERRHGRQTLLVRVVGPFRVALFPAVLVEQRESLLGAPRVLLLALLALQVDLLG